MVAIQPLGFSSLHLHLKTRYKISNAIAMTAIV